MKLDLLKDLRVLIFIFFIAFSIILIMPTPQGGVVVRSVSPDSPLFGKVGAGEKITWVNEKTINSPDDFYAFDKFKGTLRFMHEGRLELAEGRGSGLKIVVAKPQSSRLNFGMDIIGGTRVLLKPKENATDIMTQNIIAILQTRINVYGLRETKFQSVRDVSGQNYVQIEMAGGSKEEVENLLAKQGKFEGRIPKLINLKEGSGPIFIDGKNYTIKANNNSIELEGKTIAINETFNLEEIEFKLLNITNSTATVVGLVFTGDDIKSVCLQDQSGICRSFVQAVKGGYEFVFQIFTSEASANKFAKLTKDMTPIFEGGDYYLQDGYIILYLDENLITQLRISANLKGKAETQPSVQGFRTEEVDASKEKLMLQSVLQSGALPVKLENIKTEQISPTLGSEFIKSALLAGLAAVLAVAAIVFVRYRKIKIVVSLILTSVSEVLIILGIASVINYTIDLAAIAGIIASVGTGIDAQIMIVDEITLGKGKMLYTLKQKIKRAFFIIFSSASTVIAAMIPLMILGIGAMRGFAITTTIGVLVGIFIARPAFGKIAEVILEKS